METLFIGKNCIFLPEIDSTNSYAIDLLKNVNLPEGTVVHTAHQTRGKGQRGSAWMAEPGSNLTASVVLKPTFLDIKNRFFLYQVVALAVYDAMAEILDTGQFDIKIKWPNDILVNRKKVAGILIENNIQNNQINWCVAGIGMNVNQETFEGLPNATSLKSISGRTYEPGEILKLICKHLEKHYLSMLNTKLSLILQTYLKHLFGLNEWLDFEIGSVPKTMLVKGLGTTGLLLLEDREGRTTEMDVKEVKWKIG